MANKISGDDALDRLMEGNKRFVNDELQHHDLSRQMREHLIEGQSPFAVILTCADSRLLPNVIFDQGLEDLFVIRVAGNVAREKILGSIEYAVANLGVRLVMVLGHEKCGAVGAAMDGEEHEGHIDVILNEIKPAVYMARKQEGDTLENAVKNNAIFTQERIKESHPILNKAVKEQDLRVVSGYYHLVTGEVDLL